MKREEFLAALKARLNRLPADELENVLDYYNEIFLDAGEQNEEATAQSLGSIDDIARQIYAENGIDPDGRPVFFVEEQAKGEPENTGFEQERGYTVREPQPVNVTKLILLLVLFPVWFPILTVCFVLTLVFFIVGFALEIAFVAAGTGLVIGGIITLFQVLPAGLIFIGSGLILCSIFGFTSSFVFKGSFKMFVGALNKLVSIAHNIFVGGETVG